jgi:hypothetical protein
MEHILSVKSQIHLRSLKEIIILIIALIFLDKRWLDPQYHDQNDLSIKKPNEIEIEMDEPPGSIDKKLLDRIQGSLIGMALGDALGAHVEFRPHEYLVKNPVKDLEPGGTWGLTKGQVDILSVFRLVHVT